MCFSKMLILECKSSLRISSYYLKLIYLNRLNEFFLNKVKVMVTAFH